MPAKDIESARLSRRKWYAANKVKACAAVKVRQKLVDQKFREYKATLCCSVCGENHPACLQFHHLEDNKTMAISKAVSHGWAWTRLQTEIAKCVVLCANCHFKEHYKDVGV